MPRGRLLLVGLGTSFHAALGAAHALGPVLAGRCDVQPMPSFDILEEPAPPPEGSTAIVFSASGETALTNDALKWLRERKVRTVLVSPRENSPGATLSDRLLLTQYADEESWTHTVSFTAALVAVGALADHWTAGDGKIPPAEDEVADAITAAIASENAVVELVDEFAGRDRYLLTGSGQADAAAREGALKLREAAGRFCAAVGVEELLHGVIPSLDKRSVVLAISGTPAQRIRALQGLAAVEKVGAKTLLIDTSGGPKGDRIVSLPSVPRPIATALQVIPIQLLAYWTATSEGRNPDVMGLDEQRYVDARSSFGI
ncbi:MAG: SIS domain-containing protein [Thermoplasmata archaeon]|nr:SIS domain-containing protein [Thermoplasmata archaeon]